MTTTSKPAGEARERPRPSHHPESYGAAAKVTRKSAGAAPTFDRETKRLMTVASEGPKGGMISNPWVRHWAGLGPAPSAPTVVPPPPAAHPQKKAAGGAHQRASGEGPRRTKAPK
jgi:hypothetical protein